MFQLQTVLIGAVWGLSIIVALFVGGFLKSYMSKKGENLATHEDISKLVEQVEAVTRATKEIEAKISDEVWNRQKLWEMKREIIFQTIKTMAHVDSQLESLNAVQQFEHSPDDPVWLQSLGERSRHFLTIMSEFEEMALLVTTVCDAKSIWPLQEFQKLAMNSAREITNGDTPAYAASLKERIKATLSVRNEFRRELGIVDPHTASPTEPNSETK
jgi:hypothetical protein